MVIDGVDLQGGKVLYLSLHRIEDKKERWNSPAVRQLKLVAPIPERLLIRDLSPGKYAVRGFVDVTGDGELGMSERGRPTEPFGFSFKLKKRKPSLRFSRAVFKVPVDAEIGFSILGSPN